MKIALLLLVLAVIALVVIALSKRPKGGSETGTYRQRKLMTDNEEEFFGRLVAALPDHYVFPQVAMSALIESASSDKAKAHSDRLKVAQQRVDYVVCTTRCEIVAVVELDDRTHSRTKDELRDSRLEQAGIRTVRFQSRNKPKADAIRTAILGTAIAETSNASASANGQVSVGADATPVIPQ